jgi:hypothetical protein
LGVTGSKSAKFDSSLGFEKHQLIISNKPVLVPGFLNGMKFQAVTWICFPTAARRKERMSQHNVAEPSENLKQEQGKWEDEEEGDVWVGRVRVPMMMVGRLRVVRMRWWVD